MTLWDPPLKSSFWKRDLFDKVETSFTFKTIIAFCLVVAKKKKKVKINSKQGAKQWFKYDNNWCYTFNTKCNYHSIQVLKRINCVNNNIVNKQVKQKLERQWKQISLKDWNKYLRKIPNKRNDRSKEIFGKKNIIKKKSLKGHLGREMSYYSR